MTVEPSSGQQILPSLPEEQPLVPLHGWGRAASTSASPIAMP